MDSETEEILTQIIAALGSAEADSITQYVYLADGKWWRSGRLPTGTFYFYIIYPNGEIDRSMPAQEVATSELEQFAKNRGLQVSPRVRKNKGRMIDVSGTSKTMLFFYAFAPHVALLLSFVMAKLTQYNPWGLIIPMLVSCVPLVVLFVLAATQLPKSSRISALATSIAVNGFSILYGFVIVAIILGPSVLFLALPAVFVSAGCSLTAVILSLGNVVTGPSN